MTNSPRLHALTVTHHPECSQDWQAAHSKQVKYFHPFKVARVSTTCYTLVERLFCLEVLGKVAVLPAKLEFRRPATAFLIVGGYICPWRLETCTGGLLSGAGGVVVRV